MVTRYDMVVDNYGYPHSSMEEDSTGNYVEYEDYKKLEEKYVALHKANSKIKDTKGILDGN